MLRVEMASVSSLKSLTLDLPPSCIAFCTTQSQYFVVGTYYLYPKEHRTAEEAVVQAEDNENAKDSFSDDLGATELDNQKRTGSLILFQLDGETM